MTKDEALDLALEALMPFSTPNWAGTGVDKANEAIAAIKQARALDKKAENARELGLDYEPVAPVQEDWGPGPHECHSLTAAPVQEPPPECQTEAEKRAYAFGWWKALEANRATPVQEPVAWRYRGIFHEFDPSDWAEGPVTPLYTTPPAQPAPVQEWMKPHPKCDEGCLFQCTKGFTQFPECATTLPAAQRQWVRLTNEEISQIYLVNTDKPLKADWLFARAIERKLKEKNT